MEEKKKNQKLTYEQLENVCHQLSEQNQILIKRTQDLALENAFKRLDMLFKVVEYSKNFTKEFVESCTAEITAMLTLDSDTPADGPENANEED